MALTVPSAITFKIRFPAFADTEDAVIEFAIEEACRHVDESWMAGDQVLAISYMAAHFVAMANLAADSEGRETTSETIGPLSETYVTGGAAMEEGLKKTSYGERFIEYRKRNRPGFLVV